VSLRDDVLAAADVRGWVKRAIREAMGRDPVDALDDAELLVRVLQDALTSSFDLPAEPVEPGSSPKA